MASITDVIYTVQQKWECKNEPEIGALHCHAAVHRS